MNNRKLYCALAFIFLCACTTPLLGIPNPPIQYKATFLPTNSQMPFLTATALNNRGEVIGYSSHNGSFPFLYLNGTIVDLSKLTDAVSKVYDINDNREMIGVYQSSNGDTKGAYVLSLQDGAQALVTPEGVKASPKAINNAGQIVGNVYGDYNYKVCGPSVSSCAVMLFTDRMPKVLESSEYSSAVDINDLYGPDGVGQIIGYISDTHESFLYANGTIKLVIGSEICPDHTATFTNANSINNLGQIAGDCTNLYGTEHYVNYALVYNTTDGSTEHFGKSEVIPVAINDAGWVIGFVNCATSHPYPFLLADGEMYNLYRLINYPYTINDLIVVDINNKGQIIANSKELGAVLLEPICDANDCL